ncbi:hypothetical protein J7E95_18980 [Streptomyces sp. ISL-14]|nr:hypothetical protein [Streptomyces sp. ISL-14]
MKPMNQYSDRSWNYVALGYGLDSGWWKEFFTIVKMIGYEGPIVLEMEDLTMEPITGVKKSLNVLKETLPREFDVLT